ncbi:MAG: hypothetical protein FWH35_08210 [Treponema sp.]|nr:hypothetical protein [Treponema sp.]
MVLADRSEEHRFFRMKKRWFRSGLLTENDRQYSQGNKQILNLCDKV